MNTVFYPIRLIQFYKKSSRYFLYVIFIISTPLFSEFRLPEEIHNAAIASIENIYKNDFKGAEEEAKEIIKKYPDLPAGYFFHAVILDFWMNHYQTNEKENEFYRYCDQTIEKSEKILEKNPSDQWAKFFMGGADGFKGTYEARYERWITAFRYGWKGVSVLLDLKEKGTQITDVYYGIGSYDYWRSAMMKTLWFMPPINDKRQDGLKMLFAAQQNGVYTKTIASTELVNVLINEHQYDQALQISQKGLAKYPRSLEFKWGQAKSLFGLNRYKEALLAYEAILDRIEAESHNNHYNAAVCHLQMAKIYQKLGDYDNVILECNRINYYKYSSEIEKRLEKCFAEAKELFSRAQAAQKNKKK